MRPLTAVHPAQPAPSSDLKSTDLQWCSNAWREGAAVYSDRPGLFSTPVFCLGGCGASGVEQTFDVRPAAPAPLQQEEPQIRGRGAVISVQCHPSNWIFCLRYTCCDSNVITWQCFSWVLRKKFLGTLLAALQGFSQSPVSHVNERKYAYTLAEI